VVFEQVSETSVAPDGTVVAPITRGTAPAFFKVYDWAALAVFTATAPKLRLVGDNVYVGTAPVPVHDTVPADAPFVAMLMEPE
jgi:hypothetical protein